MALAWYRAHMPLVDQYGRPFPETPRKPVDVASTAHIQDPAQRWTGMIPATPEGVFSALQSAVNGDIDAYLTLAEQMEEKNLHYAAILQTRKLAVTSEEIDVLPGDESELGQQIADAYKKRVVDRYFYTDMLADLMDGLAKGFSVLQPVWSMTGTAWDYERFEHEDPRLFTFKKDRMRELRIKSDQQQDGIALRPGQFVVHMPRLRTGIPIRAGLARPAAVAYLFNSTTMRQWATFVQVFGMPLRLGKFDPATATEQELDALRRAVVNLGHDAAALLPVGMEIEFPDARSPNGGDQTFEKFARYWDDMLSKLVLGQTMTTDSKTGGLAQAKVQNEVRVDLKQSDVRQIAATEHRDVATPWVLYNFGPTAPVPHIRINVEPPEDMVSFSAAITPLINAGLRVRAQEIRDRFGLTEPSATEELVQAPPEPKPNAEIPVAQ